MRYECVFPQWFFLETLLCFSAEVTKSQSKPAADEIFEAGEHA